MAIYCFAPHPDDESLACGGRIAQLVDEGERVLVVYMTDGRSSHRTVLGIKESPSPEEVRRVRGREALRATSVLGVPEEDVHFLDYPDGELWDRLGEAEKRISRLFQESHPAEVYIPHVLDSHRDHAATAAVVIESLQRERPETAVYQYLIWGDETIRERFSADPSLECFDISAYLRTKEQAVKSYQSQISERFESQSKSVLAREFVERFLKPEERFVLSPASELEPPKFSSGKSGSQVT